MRYFVTGGTGFIGSNLVRRLARRGETTVMVQPGADVATLTGAADIRVVVADVCNGAAVKAAVVEARPTAICHLAAAGVTPGSDAAAVTATNVLGTYNLLAAIRTTPTIEGAVFAGSWYEYGPALVNDPDRIPAPTTPYGISKLASTTMVLEFASRSEIPLVVIRPFQVYGPGEPPHRLIPSVLRGVQTRVPVPLQNPGALRDWIYVDDAAAAFETATDARVTNQVIDIGTGITTAVGDVVNRLLAHAGAPARPDHSPAVPTGGASGDGPLSGAADTTQAARWLGWTASVDLDAGLIKTVEHALRERHRIAAG